MGCRYIINTSANDQEEIVSDIKVNNEVPTLVPMADMESSSRVKYKNNLLMKNLLRT